MIVSEASSATSAARVLVVDAEQPLLGWLEVLLRGAGYVVASVRAAGNARGLVDTHRPDVVLLDSPQPDGEAVETCRELRRVSKAPILVMWASGAQRDELRALGAGADDCLRKPFGATELLGRLSVLLSHSAEAGSALRLQLGDLVIDFARRRVKRAGTRPGFGT